MCGGGFGVDAPPLYLGMHAPILPRPCPPSYPAACPPLPAPHRPPPAPPPPPAQSPLTHGALVPGVHHQRGLPPRRKGAQHRVLGHEDGCSSGGSGGDG